MSDPLQVSSALLRTPLMRKGPLDPAIVDAYMTGAIPTSGPSRGPMVSNVFNRYSRRLTTLVGRKWQRSPDRAASVARKRKLGGSSGMPDTIRHHYTEGERAALVVIAGEVKHHGICDLPLDRIAAVAGVSRTTVQNAIRQARLRHHLSVEPRPRKGQKNLTNILRVVSREWVSWLKRGPSLAREIGFNLVHPTKTTDKKHTEKGSKSRQPGMRGSVRRGLGEGADGKGSGPMPHGGRGNG